MPCTPLAPLDGPAQRQHLVGLHLAGREGRRHPVRQEEQRIGIALLDPPCAEEVHRVVRVHVDETREQVLVLGQFDDAPGCARGIWRIDHTRNLPRAHDDARVPHHAIAIKNLFGVWFEGESERQCGENWTTNEVRSTTGMTYGPSLLKPLGAPRA